MIGVRARLENTARTVSIICADPLATAAAISLVIGWCAGGWSTGGLNTFTGNVSFVLLFLVLSAGQRDVAALHLKLDELIRSSGARNDIISAENTSLEDIQAEAASVRKEAGHE